MKRLILVLMFLAVITAIVFLAVGTAGKPQVAVPAPQTPVIESSSIQTVEPAPAKTVESAGIAKPQESTLKERIDQVKDDRQMFFVKDWFGFRVVRAKTGHLIISGFLSDEKALVYAPFRGYAVSDGTFQPSERGHIPMVFLFKGEAPGTPPGVPDYNHALLVVYNVDLLVKSYQQVDVGQSIATIHDPGWLLEGGNFISATRIESQESPDDARKFLMFVSQ